LLRTDFHLPVVAPFAKCFKTCFYQLKLIVLMREKKQQKSKAIAFTFRAFLATSFMFEKEAKNSKKVRQ
jgi:hypothetical protein